MTAALPTSRFTSLLCPVDFSETSRTALQYGATLARRCNAPLVVLFVNDPLLVAASAAAFSGPTLDETSTRELRQFVTDALGTRVPGPAEIVTRAGTPSDEILAAARQHQCDLIVMGSQGLRGVSKLFFGSTTEAVLRKAEIPVLAIPPRTGGAGAGSMPRAWPGARTIVPVSLDEHTDDDVAHAAAVARGLATRIVLVHVVTETRVPAFYQPDVETSQRIAVAQARERLDGIKASMSDVVVAARVSVGDPAHEVSAYAAEQRSGLIMLTLRGDTGILGTPAGVLAYHVLSHAITPVLALTPHGADSAHVQPSSARARGTRTSPSRG